MPGQQQKPNSRPQADRKSEAAPEAPQLGNPLFDKVEYSRSSLKLRSERHNEAK